VLQIWLNGTGGPGFGMARQRLQEQYVLGKREEGKLQQQVCLAISDPNKMDRSQTRTETKEQET
jgi:hypothetical protein